MIGRYKNGDNGWVFYPATATYSGSKAAGAQFSYDGVFSLNFTYTVTTGATYTPKPGMKANFKYAGQFDIMKNRYKYYMSDGSVRFSEEFYTQTLLPGGGIKVVEVLI